MMCETWHVFSAYLFGDTNFSGCLLKWCLESHVSVWQETTATWKIHFSIPKLFSYKIEINLEKKENKTQHYQN